MSKGLQNAPNLSHQGKYLQAKGDWRYDPDLLAYLMNNAKPNELKLMLYYCGNADGWGCSQENILQRTGLPDKTALSKTRSALVKRGWITYEEGTSVVVLYDAIFQEMKQHTSCEIHNSCENHNPEETQNEVENLNGCENHNPKSCENHNPYNKNEVKFTTIINTNRDNTPNNNNSSAAGAAPLPLISYEEATTRAKKVSIYDPFVKKLTKAEHPYPGKPILYFEGEYYEPVGEIFEE